MTKKSDEDSIHPSETAYDKAIKRTEEREAHIFNTPAMQIAADATEQIRIQQAPLIQALQPLQDALQPYHNLICILSIGNPQNCHQNSLFLEREFLVIVRTRFLHSGVLSGASMHAASDNFSRRT